MPPLTSLPFVGGWPASSVRERFPPPVWHPQMFVRIQAKQAAVEEEEKDPSGRASAANRERIQALCR